MATSSGVDDESLSSRSVTPVSRRGVPCRRRGAMMADMPPAPSPKVAMVLGAGGTVGHAYHAGVLSALHDVFGWDARRVDLLVGTSAGSIVAAMLRAGMPATDLAARAMGTPLSPQGQAVALRAGLGPPRPRPPRRRAPLGELSSPARLARAMRAPWEVRPGSLAVAMLPEGQVKTQHIAAPFEALYGSSWPTRPMWIIAV